MARKRIKRYDDGGEIVVTGKRENEIEPFAGLSRERMMRAAASGADAGGGGGSGAGIMISPRNRLGIGETYTEAGKVYGPRYSGDGFSVSGGYNPKSKVIGGRYDEEGFSAGLGYDPRRKFIGGDLSLSFKKGGKTKAKAKGGTVKSSASKRADGIAQKGKTKGRFV